MNVYRRIRKYAAQYNSTGLPQCDKCDELHEGKSKKHDGDTFYCRRTGRDVVQSWFGHNSPKDCPLRNSDQMASEHPLVCTSGIKELMETRKGFKEFLTNCLTEFYSGLWGEVSEEDKNNNDKAPSHAMAAYIFEGDCKIWIKRDIDVVTVLLPEEY